MMTRHYFLKEALAFLHSFRLVDGDLITQDFFSNQGYFQGVEYTLLY